MIKYFSIRLASLSFVIFLWFILSQLIGNELIFPGISSVYHSMLEIILSGSLIREVSVTAVRCFISLVITMILGISFGVLYGISENVKIMFSPVVVFLQSAPSISWLLFALIWIDQKYIPVLVIVLSTLPIVIINSAEGIVNTDKKILEMAKLFRINKWLIVKKIYIPSIAGYLIASFKILLSNTIKVGVMAEVLSHTGAGVGERMNISRINLQMADLTAWTIIIILAAYLLNNLLEFLIKKFSGGFR